MSDRISRSDVDARVTNLNRRMFNLGATIRYEVQGRNGYIGLDRYSYDGAMLDTVTVGTKREVADFLHAMMVALDDAKLYAPAPEGVK